MNTMDKLDEIVEALSSTSESEVWWTPRTGRVSLGAPAHGERMVYVGSPSEVLGELALHGLAAITRWTEPPRDPAYGAEDEDA